MTKKKVIEPPKEVVCEVAPHLTEGDALKVELHDPPRRDDIGVKKVRKPLSQESLDKLAKARDMAYKKRMELKAEREKPAPEPVPEEPKPVEEVVEEEEPDKPKKEKKKKKKPIVVVEQSSDSSDDEQQVVYIKKKKEKKKVEIEKPVELVVEPVYEPPPIQYVVPNPVQPRYGYNPAYNQQYNPQKLSNRRSF